MNTSGGRETVFSYLSLFTSFGTLLCCALPSLLVLVGLGATVASFLSAVPWLVALSHHKNWVFAVSGLLIAVNFVYIYALAPRLACPAGVEACAEASRTSRVILWISAILYSTGALTAYIVGPLLMHFG